MVVQLNSLLKLLVVKWESDYACKVEEYAFLGTPEYWIADYRGLRGVAFIGRSKQPTSQFAS
jgi:Uma2 family endonuclease